MDAEWRSSRTPQSESFLPRVPTLPSMIRIQTIFFSFAGEQLLVLTENTSESLSLPETTLTPNTTPEEAALALVAREAEEPPRRCFLLSCTLGSKDILTLTYWTLGRPSVRQGASQNGYTWINHQELAEKTGREGLLIQEATQNLKEKCRSSTLGFELLPTEFSLSELQILCETLSGRKIDVRNFRKRIDALQILSTSGRKLAGLAHRPPTLYALNTETLASLPLLQQDFRLF